MKRWPDLGKQIAEIPKEHVTGEAHTLTARNPRRAGGSRGRAVALSGRRALRHLRRQSSEDFNGLLEARFKRRGPGSASSGPKPYGATMRSFRAIVLTTGIAGGALFTVHAFFPGVRAWPMIWPAVAGAVAFWLATREPIPHRLRTGLAAAFVAGVITGAIAFVTSSVVVVGLIHTAAKPAIESTGVLSEFVMSAGLMGLAILAGITCVVAVLGGAVLLPVRYAQNATRA
jgi:hypothetical protein